MKEPRVDKQIIVYRYRDMPGAKTLQESYEEVTGERPGHDVYYALAQYHMTLGCLDNIQSDLVGVTSLVIGNTSLAGQPL